MSGVSLQSRILEAEREIRKRHEVYPRLVGAGKMRAAEAELLIGRMEAIRDTLAALADGEGVARAWLASRPTPPGADAGMMALLTRVYAGVAR